MNFKDFAHDIRVHFDKMAKHDLYVLDIDKHELWDAYLASFSKENNPMVIERTEHDCNACKRFIHNIGRVVAIIKGQRVSVWDAPNIKEPYAAIAKKLSTLLNEYDIKTIYLNPEKQVSIKSNIQLLEDGSTRKNYHFSCVLPDKFVTNQIGAQRAEATSAAHVFRSGLQYFRPEVLETVKDLINNGSLYRGEEFLESVVVFSDFIRLYHEIDSEVEQENFIWSHVHHPVARFKNTVIGTLAEDISDGFSLDDAVSLFEAKVAPTNYKRTHAPITTGMVKSAMKTIQSLELEEALRRRYAVAEDVSVNNVLWANRDTSSMMRDSVENMLLREVKAHKKQTPTREISIDDFMAHYLPKSDKVELFIENTHQANLVSVTTACTDQPSPLFKWDNNFAWSYAGGVTDSIKEKVKRAGGRTDAYLRVSLNWFNTDDLDIHVYEPSGNHIYYGHKSGKLDVDMNAGSERIRDAVENVCWNRQDLREGTYKICVNNYAKRETKDVGFRIELECDGVITEYSYTADVQEGKGATVTVFTLQYDGKKITVSNMNKGIVSGGLSQDTWGIKTEAYCDVKMVMFSPNHWDDQKIGNKHWFFILDECLNPLPTRGIYNEFLCDKLMPHRKVFEVLGAKTLCEPSAQQLSGVGFSSTRHDMVTVKLTGQHINQVLKVQF